MDTYVFANQKMASLSLPSASRSSMPPELRPGLGTRKLRRPHPARPRQSALRIAEQRLSLQGIAEELGHSLDVLAEHYAHVTASTPVRAGSTPEQLIREAGERVARGDVSRRTGRQMDAKSATKRRE
jgi:hypothetical protein